MTATAKTLTTSGTGALAIKNRYYDTLFLKIAQKQLVHKQLGQRNLKVEKGQGGYGTGVVYWTKWVNLPDVTAGQGEGVPTTAVAMTALNVTGSTAQYDAAVSISDLLAYTSFGDVMKAAMERLAYNAGLSIDKLVRNEIANSGTQINATAVPHPSGIPTTGTLNITELRKAGRTLQRNDAFLPEGGYWIGVIHPDALYDLQGDTTTGGWIDANKYTDGNATKLMTGEIGRLMGIRFLETSNAYVNDAVVTTAWKASGSIYHTNIFGAQGFGVTELQSLKTYIKGFTEGGTSDPTDKVATAGWKTTFGTSTLDSTFFVNLKHAVSSTA